jgi:hypothetical protein
MWPSKKEMLIDLVGQFATKAVLQPDTGSLRGDIQAIAHDAIAVLANPLVRSVIQSLLTEARRSPDLAAELTERFINPRRQAGAQMLRRAVDRGEVRPDSDLELALDLRRSPLPARRDPRRRVPAWLLRATHRRGAARTRRQVAL